MKEFTSIDEYHIKGRGRVIVIENDFDRTPENGRDFADLKPELMIDGVIYKVRGIETYAVHNIYKDWPLGILV